MAKPEITLSSVLFLLTSELGINPVCCCYLVLRDRGDGSQKSDDRGQIQLDACASDEETFSGCFSFVVIGIPCVPYFVAVLILIFIVVAEGILSDSRRLEVFHWLLSSVF